MQRYESACLSPGTDTCLWPVLDGAHACPTIEDARCRLCIAKDARTLLLRWLLKEVPTLWRALCKGALLRLPATTEYTATLALSWRLIGKYTAALTLSRCLVSKETAATANLLFVAEQPTTCGRRRLCAEQPATCGRRRLCADQGAASCSALLIGECAAAAACLLSEDTGCCICLLVENAASCGGLLTKDAAASASATSCDTKATPASLGFEQATLGSGCKCGQRLTLRLCD